MRAYPRPNWPKNWGFPARPFQSGRLIFPNQTSPSCLKSPAYLVFPLMICLAIQGRKCMPRLKRGSNMAMRSVMQNSSNLRTFCSRKQKKNCPLMRLTPCWVFSILATAIRFVRKLSTMARKPWNLSPTRSLTSTSSTKVGVGPYMIGMPATTRT